MRLETTYILFCIPFILTIIQQIDSWLINYTIN